MKKSSQNRRFVRTLDAKWWKSAAPHCHEPTGSSRDPLRAILAPSTPVVDLGWLSAAKCRQVAFGAIKDQPYKAKERKTADTCKRILSGTNKQNGKMRKISNIYIYIRIYTMSHSQTVFVDDDGIILHGKVLGAHRLSVQSWRHASQLMGIIKLASNPSLTATTSSANIWDSEHFKNKRFYEILIMSFFPCCQGGSDIERCCGMDETVYCKLPSLVPTQPLGHTMFAFKIVT